MQHEIDKPVPIDGLAALAVDLQPVFLDEVSHPEDFRRNLRFFLRAVNLFEIPLFLTEQVPEKLGRTEQNLLELSQEAFVFPKDKFSAFGASGLSDDLKNAGVSHLLLAGVETSICVYLTALEALSQGKAVTVLTDCVSCRRSSDGKWALRKLAMGGCHLLSVESVFYGMLGGAGHPHFKTFTKLVRERDLK